MTSLVLALVLSMAQAHALAIPITLDEEGVDLNFEYTPYVAPPAWVVPAANLPKGLKLEASNNNVALAFHDGRLYLAWRSAPTHFASAKTKMFLVSSPDYGETWESEATIALGYDVREPFFLSFQGRLTFTFFEAGKDPFRFDPKHLYRVERKSLGVWSEPQEIGQSGEIAWELKVRNGKAWKTSYVGNHYGGGKGAIDVHFEMSLDGLNWGPAPGAASSWVYHGGVSEVGYDFDRDGRLWGVTRNEDGDDSGFGSQVVSAEPGNLGAWKFPSKSSPHRYDSPRMFRHGNDLYLVARQDVGGPFDLGMNWVPYDIRKWIYLGAYSLRPKKTTLYRIDTAARQVVPLLDLPGNGDTAFASIVRLDANRFLIANYTSPLGHPGWPWITGQRSRQGTQIYTTVIEFRPR